MRKFLSVVGGIFLTVVVIAVGFLGYAAYQGRGLDRTSKAYVEQNVPAIISTWSKDALLQRASPQLLKVINEDPQSFDQVFKKLSTLGDMKSLGDLKGDSNVSYTTQNGKVTTAYYVGNAKFSNGDGRVIVRLFQSPEGQWQFGYFHVDSPLFLKP